ncbi:MAG: hypothetical protein V4684_01415 [Pseudomonadota bacterium]
MQASPAAIGPVRLPSPRPRDFEAAATVDPVPEVSAFMTQHTAVAQPLGPRVASQQLPGAVVARDLLAAMLEGVDAPEDSRHVREAVTRLLELSPQMGEGSVDKVLCGFLRDALVSGRHDLIAAWVSTIASAPSSLLTPARRLALLTGSALPVSPRAWNAGPAVESGGSHRYMGPPLLVRVFSRPKAHGGFAPAERWKAPTWPQEQALARGCHAFVSALLESADVTDAQATQILCTTFTSVGSDGPNGRRVASELDALSFAMHQGYLCAAAFMLTAIGNSDRPLATRAQLVADLALDRAQFSARLRVLKEMPLADAPHSDMYQWARDVAKWAKVFLTACDLVSEGGQVQLATDDDACRQQCIDADLRAIDFEPASKGRPAAIVCRSNFELTDFSDVELEDDDETQWPGTRLYAIPYFAVEVRSTQARPADLQASN